MTDDELQDAIDGLPQVLTFYCIWCGHDCREDTDTYPYCCQECEAQALADSPEEE